MMIGGRGKSSSGGGLGGSGTISIRPTKIVPSHTKQPGDALADSSRESASGQ